MLKINCLIFKRKLNENGKISQDSENLLNLMEIEENLNGEKNFDIENQDFQTFFRMLTKKIDESLIERSILASILGKEDEKITMGENILGSVEKLSELEKDLLSQKKENSSKLEKMRFQYLRYF